MNHSDIAVLMKGAAPAIRDFVASAMQPLVERIAELERELAGLRTAATERDVLVSTTLEGLYSRDEIEKLFHGISEALSEHSKRIDAIHVPEPSPPELPDIPGLVAEAVAKSTQSVRESVDAALALVTPEKLAEAAQQAAVPLERVVEIVRETVAELPPAEPGKSVTVEDVVPLIADEVARAVDALPRPKDGEPGKEGPPGKLPVAKEWADGVTYEGEVRTHGGSLWQARKDTGREPGHEDWICLAARGNDGRDAVQIEIMGTFDPEGSYRALNVVALNGATFIAKQDDPGPCPGEGWQLMSAQGKRGNPGEPGKKGDPGIRGLPGPAVSEMTISDQGLLTLKNADGSTVECDLYDVLAKVGQ
jgi:hypothetical protein